MVDGAGFEPAASAMPTLRSYQTDLPALIFSSFITSLTNLDVGWKLLIFSYHLYHTQEFILRSAGLSLRRDHELVECLGNKFLTLSEKCICAFGGSDTFLEKGMHEI